MGKNAYFDTTGFLNQKLYIILFRRGTRMSFTAGEIVRLIKSDRDALRELAVAVASEPEIRLAVINAVIADVATKHDIQQLRQEVRDEVSQLRSEMGQLRRDMNTNFRWTVGLIIAVWGTTVIPLLMRIAGII